MQNANLNDIQIVELNDAELEMISGGADVDVSGGYNQHDGWHAEVKIHIHF